MKKIALFTFGLIAIVGSKAQEFTALRINPDNAHGGTCSQIFDSINFIPLQTTKESLFGEINQLEVTNTYFIILDYRSRSILLFDHTGAFHARIRTAGPDQHFSYFSLNRSANEIITAVNDEKSFYIYDYNGSLLREEKKPLDAKGFYCFNDSCFLFNITRLAGLSSKDQTLYDLAYSKGYDHITKCLNPYNGRYVNYDYNISQNVFNYSGQRGSCIFTLPFDYTAYQLNDTGMLHRYNFIFPEKYSLPNNFAWDSSFSGKRGRYIYGSPENLGKYEGVQNVFKSGDFLLFTTAYSGRFKEDKNFAYNLANNDLISFGKVIGDSTSDFLPLLSHKYLEKIDAVYDDVIFSSIPSVLLFNVKTTNAKPAKYREVLQKYFATGNRDDNVVLMEMRLKKKQ